MNQEIEEIKKKYMESNENMEVQNFWDAAKAVIRRTYIAIQAYLKKQEKSQLQNLNLHRKELEKEQQKSLKPIQEGK